MTSMYFLNLLGGGLHIGSVVFVCFLVRMRGPAAAAAALVDAAQQLFLLFSRSYTNVS